MFSKNYNDSDGYHVMVKFDSKFRVIEEVDSMNKVKFLRRNLSCACLLGQNIYVIGGGESKCESYDTLKSEKKILPCNFDGADSEGVSAVAIKKRFIFAFGGQSKDKEKISRLDTFRITGGWKLINL